MKDAKKFVEEFKKGHVNVVGEGSERAPKRALRQKAEDTQHDIHYGSPKERERKKDELDEAEIDAAKKMETISKPASVERKDKPKKDITNPDSVLKSGDRPNTSNDLMKNIQNMKNYEPQTQPISKAYNGKDMTKASVFNPGARGGKVVGESKTGKPVYASEVRGRKKKESKSNLKDLKDRAEKLKQLAEKKGKKMKKSEIIEEIKKSLDPSHDYTKEELEVIVKAVTSMSAVMENAVIQNTDELSNPTLQDSKTPDQIEAERKLHNAEETPVDARTLAPGLFNDFTLGTGFRDTSTGRQIFNLKQPSMDYNQVYKDSIKNIKVTKE